MGQIYDEAAEVYRDYKTDGLKASGDNEPDKPDIRALFKTVDLAVYAAAAGFPIVADTDALATFYADEENQGKLVYVNNNNGADDDPANGVYEYVDGAPRLATGFYQGVAAVVQPIADEAAASAAAAAEAADTIHDVYYDTGLDLAPGGVAGVAQAGNSHSFIAKTFGELGLPADTAVLDSLSVTVSAYDGSGTGAMRVALIEKNEDGTYNTASLKLFTGDDAITAAGVVDVSVADLGLAQNKVKSSHAVAVYAPSASGLTFATTTDPGAQYANAFSAEDENIAVDTYDRSPVFAASLTYSSIPARLVRNEADIDALGDRVDALESIEQTVTPPGDAADPLSDNSTYIGQSLRELGVPVDTPTLASLSIGIDSFTAGGNGDLHVYLAEQVSPNVFEYVSRIVMLGAVTEAGQIDVPISQFGLTDDQIDVDWHIGTWAASLVTSGVSRAMVASPGWRAKNQTLGQDPTTCDVMTVAPNITAVVTYPASAEDDGRDAKIAALESSNVSLIDMLRVAYAREGIATGTYAQRPALNPLIVTYFFDTDYGGLIKGWGSTWYDALTGEALQWWAPGATADFDFWNDRYMLNGSEVSRATAISTDIDARLSDDGLVFTGTLGEQVKPTATAAISIFATGENAFEMLVEQADDATSQTLIDVTAASGPTTNRYLMWRRSGTDSTEYWRDMLQLNVYAGSSAVAHQLNQGQKDGFSTEAMWIRGSFGLDAVRLQDRGGAVLSKASGGVLPTGLANIAYGGRYDGSVNPFKGNLKRVIHWNKAREFVPGTMRNLQFQTINGVDYGVESIGEPYAIRFDSGLPSSPMTIEQHAGDHRPGEEDRSRTEIAQVNEVDHEQDIWASWAFKPVQMHFPGNYFIAVQLHPETPYTVTPQMRINWNEDGTWSITGFYVAADADKPPIQAPATQVFEESFDIPIGEWSWFAFQFKSSADGYARLWVNGEQVLDYSGPFGFLHLDQAGFMTFGNYLGPISTETTITKFANIRAAGTDDLSALIDAPEPILE